MVRATTGMVSFTFLGDCACAAGQARARPRKTAATTTAFILFMGSSSLFFSSHCNFRFELLPQAFIDAAKLLALVNLVDVSRARYGHAGDPFYPARTRRHHHDAIRQGDGLDQVVGDKNDGLFRRRPKAQYLLL